MQQHVSLFSGRTGVPRDLPVTEQPPLFTVTVSVISAGGRLHSRSLGVSRTKYRPALANSCSVQAPVMYSYYISHIPVVTT